ncbi:predicted protein [Nematostella vectensis]|uniref:Out at first protein homolog n=2 Tax=Nematostella vectensis TaxID=45351 RepID=A7RR26_NEMVE|nr:predicted protein [Nematostella vectensis]|eukprot:XP_001638157.1 predicted protein [Nematostella vectensis]
MVLLPECYSRLAVNVKTKAGDITKQVFESFPEKELVKISFRLNDGRYIDISLDFRKKIQVIKAIILGEMDKAENPYEAVCFAIKLTDGEYVTPDAMSKLRQKNPDTIRSPEVDVGTEEIVLDQLVPVTNAGVLTDQVYSMCEEVGFVFTKQEDIKNLISDNYTTIPLFMSSVQNLSSNMISRKRCHDTKESKVPCICRLQVCISWYPCDLKYCQGQDSDGKPTEYRCGIKTCGKCHDLDYLATEKRHCFWDDNPKS